MPTIAERNAIALDSMRERFKERLTNEMVSMTLGELIEYTESCDNMCGSRSVDSYARLACFLMQNLGYDYPDAPIVRRYTTLNTPEGIQSALSDWDNRYEMGK